MCHLFSGISLCVYNSDKEENLEASELRETPQEFSDMSLEPLSDCVPEVSDPLNR